MSHCASALRRWASSPNLAGAAHAACRRNIRGMDMPLPGRPLYKNSGHVLYFTS